MSKLSFSETVDLIFQKESQVQTLWAVYTVVQFAAGSFGMDHYHGEEKMP